MPITGKPRKPVPINHTPGSVLAYRVGCICSAIGNNGGEGIPEDYTVVLAGAERAHQRMVYFIDRKCPVHGD